MILSSILILFSLFSLVFPKRINLYVKSINDGSTDPIGFIDNDSIHLMEIEPQHSVCIGTKDIYNNECFSYQNYIPSFNYSIFNLFLDEDNDVFRIALSFDDTLQKPTIRKHKHITAPQPNLNPDSLKKQREQQAKQNNNGGNQQTEKVIRKKTIVEIDSDGNEITKEIDEVIETVDDRSWIQKNWMYIVPPLLILFAMGGGEERK
ncbi:uncharacterized protein KGF55_005415 [Candida pseudojiufengensis]|uniref:uncharacterized protein n=1 Tax=Candida pseudojiufengensis TaxID=497109 RepID=UPI002224677C|nr:uncharacterized protein KGF55_005415 [Candida pseudojiufengensis]KAI5959265.1 hypothetical protein KGF55_005415 [Candida pseudojiufengensis]